MLRFAIVSAAVMCGAAVTVRRAPPVTMKAGAKTAKRPAAARPSKGFGAAAVVAKSSLRKRWAEGAPDTQLEDELLAIETLGPSITNYLNPQHLEPEALDDVGRRLRGGEVVILRDAFKPAFAEAAYRELDSKHVPWSENEAYYDDGYAHKHLNVYDRGVFSTRLNQTAAVFDAEETKRWIGELTGRDCAGTCTGAPSHYRPGDHSLPHTDWVGQRTVAYVWHLSKDWRAEWGGALYWAQNDHIEATYPASSNSLCLFCVTTTSAHFVTTVSPHAKQKRLAYNGWWQSDWVPRNDETLDAALRSEERRRSLTHTQLQEITDLLSDPWQNFAPERKEELEALRVRAKAELKIPT